jgi:hypothetical protein
MDEKQKKVRKTREAKPGELRGIQILETMERMSKRPESRMDLQKALGKLSPNGQIYAKHLVMSGPSGNTSTSKETGLSKAEIELAAEELETAINKLRT